MATQEENWLQQYFTFRGGEHVVHNEHAAWHGVNNSSQPLFGEEFLRFHRFFVGEYDAWRAAQGHPPIPLWDPATPIPAEIPHAGRSTNNPSAVNPACKRPSWATVAGGAASAPGFPGYTKLVDFKNRNELVVRRGFGLVGEGGSASFDFGDDLFGGLGPDEGFGVVVPV